MRLFALLGSFFFCAVLQAQQVQTIVPVQPITVGTAFQVQYIVTNGMQVEALQSPAFGKDFRFVSGPRVYEGEALINKIKTPIRNFSFTLIPLRKGRLVVKGATVVYKTGKAKSDDMFVVVADQQQQEPLASTPITDLPRLAPGYTWDEKLHENLFIKAAVSKQTCFVGEPVVATFTLFSRLPSASEVLKNPGFYGCSVLDLPDAADGQPTVQTYNGTFYNTHVLRNVQLYPMQPGNLLIDKMSVTNAIAYADSASGTPVQTSVLLESVPLRITVKPLPATMQNFNGAVGTFSISSHLEKETWPQNSSGKLVLTITGRGNFLQLGAPDIIWPKRLDVFEPMVTERLQKDAVPITGSRTYTYTFTADSSGSYALPPVSFTYFNPAKKKYETATTDSLHFTVQQGKIRALLPPGVRGKMAGSNAYAWLLTAACMGVVWFLFYKKYRDRKIKLAATEPESRTPDFEKTIMAISAADTDRYMQLHMALMAFLKSMPSLAGAAKPSFILQTSTEYKIPSEKMSLEAIVEECQSVQYYNAVPSVPFNELQQQAIGFINAHKR